MNELNCEESFNNINLLKDIPIKLTIKLGKTKLTIEEILKLKVGDLIELDSAVGEDVEILIDDILIGHGEVIIVDEFIGIKITDIDSNEKIKEKIGEVR